MVKNNQEEEFHGKQVLAIHDFVGDVWSPLILDVSVKSAVRDLAHLVRSKADAKISVWPSNHHLWHLGTFSNDGVLVAFSKPVLIGTVANLVEEFLAGVAKQ